MRLRADPARIGASRTWTSDAARRAGASERAVRIVALLVTEAVANAMVHGPEGGEVVVQVDLVDAAVRVSVTDGSDALPVLRDPDPGATGGRGVMLIDRLSRAWGVDRNRGGGKTLWFEVPM